MAAATCLSHPIDIFNSSQYGNIMHQLQNKNKVLVRTPANNIIIAHYNKSSNKNFNNENFIKIKDIIRNIRQQIDYMTDQDDNNVLVLRLFKNKDMLKNNNTLKKENIKDNDILSLKYIKNPDIKVPDYSKLPYTYNTYPGKKIQVFAKTLTGKTLAISISENAPALYLKIAIQEKEGIPPDQQRLIMKGRQIEDDIPLIDQEVCHESTFHIILRLRGGMYHEFSGKNGENTPLPPLSVVELQSEIIYPGPFKNNGEPDMRFKANQNYKISMECNGEQKS